MPEANPAACMLKSETKCCLQIESAIRGAGRERPSLQRVGGIKKWRAENAAGIRHIHIIKDVADSNAEGETIAAVRTG